MSASALSPQRGDSPEKLPIATTENNAAAGVIAATVDRGISDGTKLTRANDLLSKTNRAGSRDKHHGGSLAKPGGYSAADDAGSDENDAVVSDNKSGRSPAGDADRRASDLKNLLRRTGALMEQHAQEGDHRSAQHLALAPEALGCLKQALALLQDRHAEHELLVSILQQSEQVVLTATDDCTDEDKSRETLRLARGLVEDILAHRCLEEVLRKTSYREKLEGHMRQMDEIIGSFLDPPSPSGKPGGDSCSNSQSKRDASGVAINAYEWSDEDREDMIRFCDQRYMSMLPLVSDVERVEMVKQRVEWALRTLAAAWRKTIRWDCYGTSADSAGWEPELGLSASSDRVVGDVATMEPPVGSRFEEARVLVFGSSAGQLATPDSDVDLTLCLPTRAKLIQELKDEIEACEEAVVMAEREFPEAVRLLTEKTANEKKIRRLENGLKSLKSALAESTIAGGKKKDQLRRMEAAYQERMRQETAASNASAPATPTSPSGTPGNTDIPSEETLSTQKPPSTSLETRTEIEASEESGDPKPEVADSTQKVADKEEPVVRSGADGLRRDTEWRKWKGKRSSFKHVNEANVDEACLEELRALVQKRKETVGNMRARTEKAEETLRLERKAYGEWTAKHFRRANPEQKRAINAVTSSRAKLEKASGSLKATSSIVFQIKRILEMNGFTHVFAVSRSRVPVVKTRAPLNISGHRDKPLGVDVSVNNLVALHNTRLLFTYTSMDPRFRQLLFLVKAWAKARGVNDSTKGTLSSYGHCVAALHYLIRVGVAPCLLKEHPSWAAQSDHPSAPPPFILEGIDVSFRMPESGTSTAHPLPTTGMPQGEGNDRAVRQRMSDSDDVTAVGTEERSPRSQNAVLGKVERGGKRALSPQDAGVCDLLGGYFRYFAKDFRHISEVMTMRPKSVVLKRDVWKRPKLWRTSIEDPFETFDSVNPHDLGAVISRSGQALLNKEWERGYALMQRGGADALEKLFMPCAEVVKSNPKHGLRKSEDHGRRRGHGQQRGGGGAPPNGRPRNGGGRNALQNRQLWNPGQGCALPNRMDSSVHRTASTIHGTVSPMHGMAPPVHGMASTMHGTASSSMHHGTTSISYGMASPIHGTASMNYSTAPSIPGTIPVIYTTASPNHGTAFPTQGTVSSNHGTPSSTQGVTPSTHGASSFHGVASTVHGTSTTYGTTPPVYGTVPPPSPQATLQLNQEMPRNVPRRQMHPASLSPRAMQQHPSHNLVLTSGFTGGFVIPSQGPPPPGRPPQVNGVPHHEGGVDQGRRGGRGRGRGSGRGGRGKGQRRRERNRGGGS